MAQLVSSYAWSQVDPANNWHAAVINCDGSVNSTWDISMNGTDVNGTAVIVKYAIIDNSANNAICSIIFGPFTFTIPPYTRRTFQLPSLPDDLYVLVSVGVVIVTLTDYDTQTPDEQNLQAIQASTANVAYPFFSILASRSQASTDGNHSLVFVSASQITYSLLQASTLTNGFYNPVLVNRGTGVVEILPYAGDTINGIYTNANPLYLSPGDSIQLGGDGSTWWAEGEISVALGGSGAWSLSSVSAYTVAHGLGKQPRRIELFLQCVTAEGGYAVGNEIPYSPEAAHGQASISNFVGFTADATNIYFNRPTWNGVLTLASKSANSYFAPSPANWAFVARAYVKV